MTIPILLAHTPQMRRNYYGERALAGLQALGDVALHEGEFPLDTGALIERARSARIVVADRATAVPGEVFAALPDLAAVVRVAVDIRNIDVAAASQAGVLVTRASPAFVTAVVELIVGYMIDLSRDISRAVIDYRTGRMPEAAMGRELAGSTLGIIGYGSIGRRLAQAALALGMRVTVCDPFQTAGGAGIEQCDLPILLAESDFVVCLVVANEQTECLMDQAAFARMKRDAFFINASRGNLVDDEALMNVLQDGGIAGAALDVGREPDQMPSRSLARLPNVIATPHIGGLTPPAISGQALETVEQVRALLRGELPKGAANGEQWRRRSLIAG